MHLLADLTAGDLGGYHAVLAVHAEGSVEAEKMQILRSYDPRPAYELVGEARPPRRLTVQPFSAGLAAGDGTPPRRAWYPWQPSGRRWRPRGVLSTAGDMSRR